VHALLKLFWVDFGQQGSHGVAWFNLASCRD
jgi:hypothetical protein